MALEQPFNLFVGTDKNLVVTVASQDVTNWQIAFKLWRQGATGAPLITKTIGNGIAITNGPGGIFTVTILSTDTDTPLVGPGFYWHTTERTDSTLDDVLTYGDVIIRSKPPRIV